MGASAEPHAKPRGLTLEPVAERVACGLHIRPAGHEMISRLMELSIIGKGVLGLSVPIMANFAKGLPVRCPVWVSGGLCG